jgi:hypothetical protein
MSRSGSDDWDCDESFPNEWAFWERRTRQVLSGRPGRKALAELREALLALPDKRLVANALSTAGKRNVPPSSEWYRDEHCELLETQGEGVCAVGAFVWHQRVKAGVDPVEAMRELPLNPDYDGDPQLTVETGKRAGLSMTLAWELMSRNDDTYGHLTPEERYEAYLAWIDQQLGAVTASGGGAA